MNQRLTQLAQRFRQQQQFADEYSPLYAALFGTVADWLTYRPHDPAAKWLLAAASTRAAFDVTNLLAAGLHYEVLRGSDEVSELAAYYPTVGGDASSKHLFGDGEGSASKVTQNFEQALQKAVLARQNSLETFMQTNTVQTNETGRGISWLLPLSFSGLAGVHLLDLGASAGLNLIAEQRAFQFVDAANDSLLLQLGLGEPTQFRVHINGDAAGLIATSCRQPQILSRTGCDIHPFRLESTADEQTLTSFVWADQVERVRRLREGVAAFQMVQQSEVPVRLFGVNLPDDLTAFLNQQKSGLLEPLAIYNTYIRIYLPDKGKMLRMLISDWAERQQRVVVWIQWEPPSLMSSIKQEAPNFGWLAWTVEVWHKNENHRFQLGWVHPHGQQIELLPGLAAWHSFWERAAKPTDFREFAAKT